MSFIWIPFLFQILFFIQISMNAKKGKPNSVLNAAAKIPEEATSALVVENYCISGTI